MRNHPRTDALYCPEFGTIIPPNPEEGYRHACTLEHELTAAKQHHADALVQHARDMDEAARDRKAASEWAKELEGRAEAAEHQLAEATTLSEAWKRDAAMFKEALLRSEAALSAAYETAAKVAENVRGGYTAAIRTDESEQEFVRDPDGPWVLNSDVAAAIRSLPSNGSTTGGGKS